MLASVGTTSRRAVVALLVAFALTAAACGGDDGSGAQDGNGGRPEGRTPDGGLQNGEVLRIAATATPTSLDPARAGAGDPQSWFLQPAYDSLLYRQSDGSYEPGLAASWGYVGSGNTVFELTLRSGVRFSDGSELTAEGVKQWIEYMQASGSAIAAPFKTESVEVTGALTLRLVLQSPDPSMPWHLSHASPSGMVINPAALEDPEALGTETAGAGPYMLDSSQTITEHSYVYVPNPHYWNEDGIHWDRIDIRVVADSAAGLLAMRAGEVDYMIGSPETAADAQSAGFQVLQAPAPLAKVMLVDREGVATPALGDVRVRQALNHALDREAISEVIYGEFATATIEMSVPGGQGYVEELEDYYPYDVERALDLLEEAGYPDGFTLPMLAYDTQPGLTRGAEAIASYWSEIGVTVDITVPSNTGDLIGSLTGGQPSTWIWSGNGPDFAGIATQFQEAPFANPYGTSDEVAERLLEQAKSANDADRPELFAQLQERWLELAWFAPFAAVDQILFVRPGLEGAEDQMSAMLPFPSLLHLAPAGD